MQQHSTSQQQYNCRKSCSSYQTYQSQLSRSRRGVGRPPHYCSAGQFKREKQNNSPFACDYFCKNLITNLFLNRSKYLPFFRLKLLLVVGLMERESQLKSGGESGGFSFRLDQFELEPCDKFEYGPFLCRARRTFRPSPDCGQINRELQWCLTVVLCSHFYDEIMSGIDPYYSSLPLLLVQGCSLTVYRYCSY